MSHSCYNQQEAASQPAGGKEKDTKYLAKAVVMNQPYSSPQKMNQSYC